jgi:uncharacterized protein with GYD domain
MVGDPAGQVGIGKQEGLMREISKSMAKVARDEVTYIFLIEDTAKGATLGAAARRREFGNVNALVRKAGGQCRLYSTRGSSCDFVSIISGISHAAAIRIAEGIESTGVVKATLISGLEIF